MTVVSRAQIGNEIAEIRQDEYAESPRELFDNLGTMICWHRRYQLGDRQAESKEEIEEIIERDDVIFLPLYLYDHSGISMSTNRNYPFNCRWDSMQVGIIFAQYEIIKKEYDVKVVTPEIREKVIEALKNEVETYNQYLTNDIYDYIVYKLKRCKECGHVSKEILDSCTGFYGHDFENNGIFDSAITHKFKDAEWEDVN